MSFVKRKNWGRVKPPAGATLNWSDPINEGLYVCHLFTGVGALGQGGVTSKDLAGPNVLNTGGFTAGSTTSSGWNAGLFGPTLTFDGTDDRISFGTTGDANFNKVSGFQAVSIWFKTTTSGINQTLVSKGGGGTITTGGWYLSLNASSQLQLTYKRADASNGQNWASSTTYADGRWHHVVCSFCLDTVTQANNAATMCVDGVEISLTRTDTGLPVLLSGAFPKIACREGAVGTNSLFWRGQLDNFRFYIRALSDGEANRLFNEPFAGILPPRSFFPLATTTDNPLVAPLGQLTLSGLVPTLTQGNSLTAPLGQLTLGGLVPSFIQGNSLTAPFGTLTLNGLVPTITQGNSVAAPLGTLTLQGLDATFLQTGPNSITAPLGVLALQGLDATFVQSGQVIQPSNLTGAGGGRRLHKEVSELQYVREIEKKLKQGVGIREAIKQLKESPNPEVRAEATKLARKAPEKIQKSAKTVSRLAELLRREIPADNISGQVADNLDDFIKAYVDDEDAVIAKVVELTARIIGA